MERDVACIYLYLLRDNLLPVPRICCFMYEFQKVYPLDIVFTWPDVMSLDILGHLNWLLKYRYIARRGTYQIPTMKGAKYLEIANFDGPYKDLIHRLKYKYLGKHTRTWQAEISKEVGQRPEKRKWYEHPKYQYPLSGYAGKYGSKI